MRNPIILALDVATLEQALPLARQLAPVLGAIKIGSELFTATGPQIVRQMRELGLNVFLDLKFHDIPNTVAKAVSSAVQLDVQMLTIHTGGGSEMMKAAEKSAKENAAKLGKNPPLVLGVTILTSLDSNAISEVGYPANVAHQVDRLAKLAVASGLRGLVCSPLEVVELRRILPRGVQLVTPGIRPADS
ncbi:MAG: orotidine-5'-phosphate decarboxylase, partial [Limisphaerales bacterium]